MDNGDIKYYEALGWLSPTELILSALEVSKIDSGLALVLSQLAVVRANGSSEMETEISDMVQAFLKKHIPEMEELQRRMNAKYN